MLSHWTPTAVTPARRPDGNGQTSRSSQEAMSASEQTFTLKPEVGAVPWIPMNDLRVFLEENQLLRAPQDCPRCGAAPGESHKSGCTVERCSACAGQRFSCNCGGQHDRFFARWTGFWPGELECIALGLLCRWQPDPRNPVPADSQFRNGCTTADLNRLIDLGCHRLFHMKPSPRAWTPGSRSPE